MNLHSTERQKISSLHGRQRMEYIWDYYKLPIFLILLFLYAACYLLYHQATKKETRLYAAFVNIDTGENLLQSLTEDYLIHEKLSPKKNQIYTYRNLYLSADPTDNPQITAASQVKITAAIAGKELDLVFMTGEVYRAFAEKDYLYDLRCVYSSDPALTDSFALDLSGTEFFQKAGFTEPVYLGIIANTPRLEDALRYTEYLFR